MEKIAFKMHLKPGCKAEYKKRHDALWPELKALLNKEGISNYFIFLDEETNTLFATQELSGQSSQSLGQNSVVKRWWDYMADIMEVNPDNSPITTTLEQVFYME